MSTHYLEGFVPTKSTLPHVPFGSAIARLKSAGLAATRGVWEFLLAVSRVRVRKEMLAAADSVAAAQPQLAERLRRAARESWAQ